MGYFLLFYYYIFLGEINHLISWNNGIAACALLLAFVDLIKKIIRKEKIWTFEFISISIIAILAFIFAIEQNREDKINSDKKEGEIIGLKTQLQTIHHKDSLQFETDKKTIIDSVSNSKSDIIEKLRELNEKQSYMIDSLIRAHGEKELTNAEKKDIIDKINKIKKANKNIDNLIGIEVQNGANAGKFPEQLTDFLQSKGFQTQPISFSAPTLLKGYKVETFMNHVAIYIGGF